MHLYPLDPLCKQNISIVSLFYWFSWSHNRHRDLVIFQSTVRNFHSMLVYRMITLWKYNKILIILYCGIYDPGLSSDLATLLRLQFKYSESLRRVVDHGVMMSSAYIFMVSIFDHVSNLKLQPHQKMNPGINRVMWQYKYLREIKSWWSILETRTTSSICNQFSWGLLHSILNLRTFLPWVFCKVILHEIIL